MQNTNYFYHIQNNKLINTKLIISIDDMMIEKVNSGDNNMSYDIYLNNHEVLNLIKNNLKLTSSEIDTIIEEDNGEDDVN